MTILLCLTCEEIFFGLSFNVQRCFTSKSLARWDSYCQIAQLTNEQSTNFKDEEKERQIENSVGWLEMNVRQRWRRSIDEKSQKLVEAGRDERIQRDERHQMMRKTISNNVKLTNTTKDINSTRRIIIRYRPLRTEPSLFSRQCSSEDLTLFTDLPRYLPSAYIHWLFSFELIRSDPIDEFDEVHDVKSIAVRSNSMSFPQSMEVHVNKQDMTTIDRSFRRCTIGFELKFDSSVDLAIIELSSDDWFSSLSLCYSSASIGEQHAAFSSFPSTSKVSFIGP